MMTNSEAWYVVKQPGGHCEIIRLESQPEPDASNPLETEDGTELERWGPFDSQGQAIARRVGLIRSGKCNPV